MTQLPHVVHDWPTASKLWGFTDGCGIAHSSPYGFICEGRYISILFPAELDKLPQVIQSKWSDIFSRLSPDSDTVAVDIACEQATRAVIHDICQYCWSTHFRFCSKLSRDLSGRNGLSPAVHLEAINPAPMSSILRHLWTRLCCVSAVRLLYNLFMQQLRHEQVVPHLFSISPRMGWQHPLNCAKQS